MKKIALFTVILLLFSIINSLAQTRICSVSGRAINKKGQPLSKALLVFGDKDFLSDAVGVSFSDEDGYFYHSADCLLGKSYLLIFPKVVSEKNPFVLVDQVSLVLVGNRSYKNLSGIRIKNQIQNVGKVIAPSYRQVQIKFQNKEGKDLFTNGSDWLEKMIRVKTISEKLVTGRYVPEKAIQGNSTVTMFLPEGKWRLEVMLDKDERDLLSAHQIVNVINSDKLQIFTLKMIPKRR